MVDLAEMNSVHVDPVEQTARVEPGVRAGELHHETQQFGLAAPTGSANDIPIRLHRTIPDDNKLKQVTVKKDPTGEWLATCGLTDPLKNTFSEE